MGQVMMVRRGDGASIWSPAYAYTYTGNSRLVDEGDGDWSIRFLTGGEFTSHQDVAIEAFVVGGGGAGNRMGGAGGGGYSTTATGIAVSGGLAYPIEIGAGGASSGAAGGNSTAFNCTGNGGNGGVAGTIIGQSCVVTGTSGSAGNVYYYASLSASALSIGDGQRTVQLAYPITGATHQNGTYLRKGLTGYYRCSIQSYGDYITTKGSGGKGGSAKYAFGGSGGTQYGGAGSAPSTANGGANRGKGGGGSDDYKGNAFGKGGSGIVIIRNAR